MTAKQHEVLALLADNRTSKEIAFQLGVSESAIVQRVEAVRSRTGQPARAELARAYRRYLDSASFNATIDTAKLELLEARDLLSTWQRASGDWLLPGAMVGPNAGFNRMAAMSVIAAGMAVTGLTCLALADAIKSLL